MWPHTPEAGGRLPSPASSTSARRWAPWRTRAALAIAAFCALACGGCVPRVVNYDSGHPIDFKGSPSDSALVLFVKVFYGEWGVLTITPPDPKVRGRRVMQARALSDPNLVFPREKGFSIFTPLVFITYDAYHDYEFVLLAPGMAPVKGLRQLSGEQRVTYAFDPSYSLHPDGALNTLETTCCQFVTGDCNGYRKPSLTPPARRRLAAYVNAELDRIEGEDAALGPRAEALRQKVAKALR